VAAMVGRGKKAPAGHIPFTPRAKKTLELSLREALALKHKYIGTEHVLLGLIREGEGVAVQIMREHADPAEIRTAVLDAVYDRSAEVVQAEESAEEGSEEANAVLRWLRQRLTLRHAAPPPFQPGVPGTTVERPSRGTPAVEAALEHAARLAGPLPVGSHHLLLAALDDTNSAASWALASLGVDLDELRSKLRTARLAGTTDEQPEQAGRRQMSINVSDEMLTIVLTDPVIVEAGKEALRTLNARKAAAMAQADDLAAAAETSAAETETSTPAGSAVEADHEDAGAASVTSTVIRGDHPAAAGLAHVWLELRKTLAFLADTTPPARRTRIVRATASSKFGSTRTSAADPAEEAAEPGEAEETA
jgi:ATP-dependent Clp protease ATP-binding subunit ClpA